MPSRWAVVLTLLPWAWATAASPDTPDAEVTAYLAELARPIPVTDGSWIDPYIDGHRVVLIGEETHGIAEHLALKAELATRLITHHGFTHILFEDDVFKADSLDANLRSPTPRPSAAYFHGFFWCWNVSELHTFFDTVPRLQPIPTVGGLDVQTPSYVMRSLEGKAETDDQHRASQALQGIFEGGRSRYAERTPNEKARDIAAIDSLPAVFRPTDIGREYRHLRRVQAVWAVSDDHGLRMNARDRGMAESLMDLLDQDPTARVIVFTHNAHAGYAPFYESFTSGVIPLGRHLREQPGVKTLSIGAVFATGSILLDPRARERNGGPIADHRTPPPDSQAEVWITIPHDRWLLDVRNIDDHDLPAGVVAFLESPPAGCFNNYGSARPLDESYDLIVGYRSVTPATSVEESAAGQPGGTR